MSVLRRNAEFILKKAKQEIASVESTLQSQTVAFSDARAADLTAHVAAPDPHPGYATDADLTAHAATIATSGVLGHIKIGPSLVIASAVVDVRGLTIAAGKTATINNTLTLSGTDGKALTLTGSLTIGADTTLTGGGTIALGGFTLTVPATGTAALLATANIFTAVQTISTDTNDQLVVKSASISASAVNLQLHTYGTIAGAGQNAQIKFMQNDGTNDLLVGRLLAAFANSIGSRYVGFVAAKDKDGERLPLRFLTSDSSDVGTTGLFIGADTNVTKVLVGNSTSPLGQFTIRVFDATYKGQVIRLAASQTADAFAIEDNAGAGSTLMLVDPAGIVTHRLIDGGTNSIAQLGILDHRSTGTPAAGFGASLDLKLKSSTTNEMDAGRIAWVWATATHASRKGRLVLSAYDTAIREGIRVEASGTAPMLGFFGGAAVAKPAVTGSRGGNAALASLLTALANLGLLTDSSTA